MLKLAPSLLGVFLALITAPLTAEEAAPAEIPVILATTGGSLLLGLLSADKPLVLRRDRGVPLKLETGKIKSIIFGERYDPNLENDALVALGDIQSDKFKVREGALAKLRALGRAAIRPLRSALSLPDAEVQNRARELLAEMNVHNAANVVGDRVMLSDGTIVNGEFSPAELTLRSRWGVHKFPIRCIETIEFLKPGDVNPAKLAAPGQAAVAVGARNVVAEKSQAERIENPFELAAAGRGQLKALAGVSLLNMDKIPNPDPNAAAAERLTETKEGDRLETAYASWGVLLKATNEQAAIQVSQEQIGGFSNGFSAHLKNSDCNVSFVVPGTFDPKSGEGRAGGVLIFGAVLKAVPGFTYGLAVYDRAGRQLAEINNFGVQQAVLPNQGEFIAVRSKVPIARARFFRMGEGNQEDLVIDDICYDRIISIERPPGNACVWLSSKERLAGDMKQAALEQGMTIRVEFLDENAAPVQIAADEIERFEPARVEAADSPAAEKIKKRRGLGTPHGVLLQSGESFRALFMKLDEKDALFMLPGGVELKLPKQTLRKIDFIPEAPEPGQLAPAVSVAEEEKPGVDFIRREDPKKKEGNAAAAPEEKKKKDLLQTTQELQRMDNVEIVEADIMTGELTMKDENGPWTIGLAPVKTLVFPKDPNAKKAAAKFRDWVLTLREGSSFEIALIAISAETLTAEMAGGTVTLPLHVIDSIQRQKR